MKSFSVKTTIGAPADAIWRLLTDAPSYTGWNTTVSKVDGTIAPGETVTVHAKISPGRAFPVKVVEFEPAKRMVWSSGMPLGLFKGARVFELRPAGVNQTQFSMREDYTGLLAGLITKSIPDLQPAFDEFAACLKRRAEGK